MDNLAEMFEEKADGPILAAVIGNDYRAKQKDQQNDSLYGKVISWERAKPLLSYEYDSGFGSADCHAVYAWTKNLVLFVHEYDGSTAICSVPRKPVPCNPSFGGN